MLLFMSHFQHCMVYIQDERMTQFKKSYCSVSFMILYRLDVLGRLPVHLYFKHDYWILMSLEKYKNIHVKGPPFTVRNYFFYLIFLEEELKSQK